MTRGAYIIVHPEWGDQHPMDDTVHETEHHTHSQLLGPDGRPLTYAPRPSIGFDLTPKRMPLGDKGRG